MQAPLEFACLRALTPPFSPFHLRFPATAAHSMSTLKRSPKPSCGIDFGTSNSAVAISGGNGAKPVPIEDGRATLPSALFFHHAGGRPLFGRAAIAAYLEGEEGRLMRGLKKVLGTPLMDDKTVIQGRTVGFGDILAIYIRHLKEQAELHAGHEIRNAVLGRPVHFHDNRPDLDDRSQEVIEAIARQAGFENVRFQLEPIAAAFAHEANFEDEKLSLVIDLGGGTSDFTVMRLSRRSMNKPERSGDILATAGIRVGGTTFDYRLSTRYFMPQLGLGSEYRSEFDATKILTVPSTIYAELSDWHLVYRAHTDKAIRGTRTILRRSLRPERIRRLLSVQQQQLGYALLEQVEGTKIALASAEEYEAQYLGRGMTTLRMPFKRRHMDEAIREDIEKIFASIDDCVSAAGVTRERIDCVILTGGSTELPAINARVRAAFPRAEISQGNKFDSVGLGLAHYAAHAFGG
jgi:hypothetical chaperone protein